MASPVKAHRKHAVSCTEISSERLSGGNSMLVTIFRLPVLHFGHINGMPNRPQDIDKTQLLYIKYHRAYEIRWTFCPEECEQLGDSQWGSKGADAALRIRLSILPDHLLLFFSQVVRAISTFTEFDWVTLGTPFHHTCRLNNIGVNRWRTLATNNCQMYSPP